MIIYLWTHDANGLYSRQKIIDNATSVIWRHDYQGAGYFELYIRATAEMLSFFRTSDVMLTKGGDNRPMFAESVKLTTSFEDGDYLTITGRSAECILERRILREQTMLTGKAEVVLRNLIISNFLAQTPANRYVPYMAVGVLKNYAETVNRQATGKDILTICEDICKEQNYGFKIYKSGDYLVFEVYKPTDKSYGQTDNPRVVFSTAFENLGNTEYSYDASTYRNCMYVAGEGEGSDRTIVQVGTNAAGLARREKWVDARNSSSTTAGGTLTPTEYRAQLREQGLEEIAVNNVAEVFSGEVISDIYRYGVDYELGDLIAVENEYGLRGSAQVTAITEVEDGEGYRIYPTLSDWTIYSEEEDDD